MKVRFTLVLLLALLLNASLGARVSAAVALQAAGLTAAKSGQDFVVFFPTSSQQVYTLQTCSSLLQPWVIVESGIPGDGTVQTVRITNAFALGNRFYRLVVRSPASLTLPQDMAFAVLGHWCGGIREQTYVTGFDPSTGYPTGEVYLSTSCSTGGRGSPPATFTAWAAVSWDFGGNVISSGTLSNGPPVDAAFRATDAFGDLIYNAGGTAYLLVPSAAAPTNVTAVQSGDEFQVSWAPSGVNPAAVLSSTLTATPVNSTASTLSTTGAGSATTGVIAALQPQTTYQITVVNTTLSGSSPPSMPVMVTTHPPSMPPSAPTGVTATWASPDPAGTVDTLVVAWQAAVPGDSPVDQYQVAITGTDGGGSFTQRVSGTVLTASFSVDDVPNWTVAVQAHNASGWGAWSDAVTLGGL
jgi:hypothetical protein